MNLKRNVFLILQIILIMLTLWGGTVEAANFRMTASTTKVKPNGSFTISVGGDCIGRVNLKVTNGTLSASSVWVEQNYQKVTVKAGNSGSVVVTATPATGFSDADANEYKPGSRSVKVTINSTSSGTTSTKPSTNQSTNSEKKPQIQEEQKSSNNLLSALNVSNGNLEPNFDANISEYQVKLPKDAQSILVNATSQDKKATIKGTGEVKLELGENKIEVAVTAENGSKKVYTIKAYVDETPQVYLKYKEEEIGIVRNLKGLATPEGFSKKIHTINEYQVDIFDNGNFSMIYGINSQGIKNFYIIDVEKNELYSSDTSTECIKCEELAKQVNNKQIIIYVLVVFLLFSIAGIIFLIFKLKKGKSNEKVH
ncbi:MAG: cadherin-like beta sandwich domain-containing protein [Clostridia bacterium]|nr:cadherin-like beta sandwich domain-containing protein [Clostridia bacterium]